MKKLIITSGIILILGLLSCKKETITSTLPEEIATGKPSAPPPPPPSILQWQKTYGSASTEMGFAITNSSNDNGYVFAGTTLGDGGDVSGYHGGTGADAWVGKIDGSGTIVWQKCIGGTNSDYTSDIITTSDGGYVFAGNSKSNDGDVPGNRGGWDVWIVKLDASGTIVWSKTYGGSGDEINDLHPSSIVETSDGGFLFAGYTNSNDGDVAGTNHGSDDVWVLKLNSSGDLVWQKPYGGTAGERGNSIIKAADGNYMISGYSSSTDGDLFGQLTHGGIDGWLFKINDSGDMIWQKKYGGSQNDNCDAVLATSDGGYIFSGSSQSTNGDVIGNNRYSDTWVVKINGNGNIAWQKFFGGNDVDNADVRHIDANGNILLTGYTFSKNGDIPASKGGEDLWILRLDGNGNKLYSDVFGGKGGDMANGAIPTSDGGYITLGRTSSTSGDVSSNHGGEDVWVMKFKF